MIKLNVLNLLAEKGKTQYWLYNQMGMSSTNFKKMAENETKGLRYTTIEMLCRILECQPNDLFVITDDLPKNEQ